MKNDKAQGVVILVLVEGRNQASVDDSGRIRTKSATQSYRDNFDTTFGKKENTLN